MILDVPAAMLDPDALPLRLAVIDAGGACLYVNAGFARASGREGGRCAGLSLEALLGEAAAGPLRRLLGRALQGEIINSDGWVQVPGGARRFVRRTLAPHRAVNGAPACVLVEIDLTPEPGADVRLRTSEAIKSAAVAHSREAVVTIDASGMVVDFNPAASRMFGYGREQALGRPVTDLIVPPEMRQPHREALEHYLAQGLPRSLERRVEAEAMQADGTRFPVEMMVTEVRIGDRRLFTALLRDLSDQSDRASEHDALAFHDPITGLHNRTWLLRAIADGLARERPMVLILVDIDRFSGMRNSFGHAFADDMIIGLAARLAAGLEPGDALVRFGDDELGLLLRGERGAAHVPARLEAVSEILRSVAMPSGAQVFLSASVGVAATDRRHEAPQDLIRDAEIAKARARETGGSRWVWFDPSMRDHVIEKVRIEHDLRAALHRGGELWVAYQPIVELISGRLAGFEALMRWNHPERGSLPPGHFIPIAEQTGLVVLLGRWVLGEACRQMAAWQAGRARGLPELFMSVNMSPRQLEEPGFVDTVREAIADSGIDPRWLKLEITESAVMNRPEDSIAVLSELKALGVQLSIDDFGTGYSSLSYLHKFPVDSIKVDRSFVSALTHSEENRSIVRIIVDLARLLGFDVIAEGIESDEDANLLRALACDYGQGYYYARPQPPAQIEALLSAPRPPWMDAPRGSGQTRAEES